MQCRSFDERAGSPNRLDSLGASSDTSLVIYFGNRERLADGSVFGMLRDRFPAAHLLGCSTGGQIHADDMVDDDISGVAIQFDGTDLKCCRETIEDPSESFECGARIGRSLSGEGLVAIFVLSDGLHVNGSQLVAGLTSVVSSDVCLTGGLSGDGAQFAETIVGLDDVPQSRRVVAVGFYGPNIRVGHGSAGGWNVFGPRRQITKSIGNVLYELDGEPALDLYERYLGKEESKGLPGTALLFPLQIFNPLRPDDEIVRTVLSVDREKRSMTFAGDMPEGWISQLMRGNFDNLAAGAADAARQARPVESEREFVSILVSCIGRRLLMGHSIADEIDAARTELGDKSRIVGFYSYGEISPHGRSGICELHNQTMTVTTLYEQV